MKKIASILLLCWGAFTATAQEEKQYSLIAVGDIMMGTTFPNASYLPADGVYPFEKVADELSGADIVFGNLEGVFSDTGKNAKRCKDPSKCYSFRMPEKFSEHLVKAGFNLMSVANNHIGDFGQTGITNTLNALESNNIEHAGVLKKPYTIFTLNGVKYGFCAFAPNRDCVKLNGLENAKNIVRTLAGQCDVIIVSFHGGAEGKKATRVNRKTEYFYGENRGNVYAFAHALIDEGADIVLGHGPHVARAFEVYKNKFIAYSLGNFCTYKRFNLSGISGYAPIVNISFNAQGDFIKGTLHSALQQRGVYPYIDSKKSVLKEIKRLTTADFPESNLIFDENGDFYVKKE